MVDLAVVIVTWNIRDLALQALQSLYKDLENSGLATAIYVVDSASTDGTPEAIAQSFPQVNLTASKENLGFGGGNNTALRQIGFGDSDTSLVDLPRAVYLLNPDTIVQSGSTRRLFDSLMADEQTGLVGANLSYGDGSFQHGAFHFPGLRQLWVEFFPTPGRLIEGAFNGRYSQACYDSTEPFNVDFTLGATMMLKREVIQQTGMFDEDYFMYCEEIDWAWRIHRTGWGVKCVPDAHVVHLAGQSTSQVHTKSIKHLWKSRLQLFTKYYPAWKLMIAKRMISFGMARKARLASTDKTLNSRDRKALAVTYLQIRRMALE